MHPQRTEAQCRGTPVCRGVRRARIWSMGSCRGPEPWAFSLLASRNLHANILDPHLLLATAIATWRLCD